jgi:NAD(P)-dependent dehydrogenase (short-subunit alcohol dehydrogenase family)
MEFNYQKTLEKNMRLENKISIITGCCGGIGNSIAVGFLKEGAAVVIVDIDEAKGEKLVRDILIHYNKMAIFIKADVSNSNEVNEMADKIFKRFNKIDVLVNCAGIYEDALMLDMSDEEWDKTLKINLYGCFYCSRAVGSYMKKQRSGSIINISFIGGQKAPSIGHAHYAASKAGMIGFTRAVAYELAPFGIRVNNICPGVTEGTSMGDRAIRNVGKEYIKSVPLGKFAVPTDIAYGAIYLASDEANYITGATLSINGGIFME